MKAMLDIKILNSLRTLGEDFLHELISIYLRDAPAMITQLENAAQENNGKTGSMAAHSLKGSSYSLGIRTVGDICNELEDAFDDQSYDGLVEKVQQLKKEQQLAEGELKHLQQQLMRSMMAQPKEI